MHNSDKTYIPVDDGFIEAVPSSPSIPQFSGAPNPDEGVSASTPDTIPLMKGYNQFVRQSSLNQQQHQNAMLQMQRSQDYNLQNMKLQNQFQIEAEERAQKWNSIGAQIDRGQRAGVSALATIGAGSSQSMGVSSAPSSHTPQPIGTSAGQADGGIGFGDIAKLAIQSGLQFANLKADLNLKHAEAFNLRQQGNESISREFGNWIDNSFKPYLNAINLDRSRSEALSAKCKAILESYWITGKDESGNPLYQSKIKTELRKAIADAGLKEQEQDTSFAMMWNFITSGFKNISEANLADTEATDLEKTVESRIESNKANAREANARAYGHELSNRDYEYYGIDKNTDFLGIPLLPIVRIFEELDDSVHNRNPKGLGTLLMSIKQGMVDGTYKDFKSISDFIQAKWKDVFGTDLPKDKAEQFSNYVIPSNTGTPGKPHSGYRNGITIAK